MFQIYTFKGLNIGYKFENEDALLFFGNRRGSLDVLAEAFPNLSFSCLHQVHGTQIVAANPNSRPKADGQYTREPGIALVIQTADCLPILFAGAGRIAAVHAGWRGLANRIVVEALKFGPFSYAAVGPHIRKYEVGLDVAEQLQGATDSKVVTRHPQPNKAYVNLSAIALDHLKSLETDLLPDDTLTSEEFYSYRRGKDKSDRQFSFVALRGKAW